MHRSGTSAVASLFNALGAQLGTSSTLMPAHESNARGHYEQLPIVAINDEILQDSGGHWLWPPQTGSKELQRLANSEVGVRAAHALATCGWNPSDMGPPFLVKDPRFCVTLPFWRELLSDRFQVVVVYRHPDEVAASLAARNQIDPEYSIELWAEYNRRILEGCEGLRVLGINHQDVLAAPDALAQQLAERFGLSAAISDSPIQASLRSHHASSAVPQTLAGIWRALNHLDGTESAPTSLEYSPKSSDALDSVVRAITREHADALQLHKESDEAKQATIQALHDQADRAEELSIRIADLQAKHQNEIDELSQEKHLSEEHLRAYLYSKAASPTRLFWQLKERITGQVPPSQRFIKTASASNSKNFVASIPTTPSQPVSARSFANPLVSIVVPVHGKLAFTSACLQSIVRSTDATPYEIIVVDDASTDETPQWLSECDNVRVVHMPANVGYLRATNAGVEAASGTYVCLLNNDVLVQGRWLKALLKPFQDRKDTGAVGAQLVYPDGSLQEAGGIIFSDGSGWNYGRGEDPLDYRFLSVRPVDFASAACLMVRKDLWDQLGGFDERYCPAYYEDVDLAFRLREHGYQVLYQPEAAIVHFEGQSHGTDKSVGLKSYQTRNRHIFAERWADELRSQPPPGSAPDSAALRTAGPRVLVVDHQVPTPDADAGSLRMILILESLVQLHCHVTFVPANGYANGHYGNALRQAGVELRVPKRPTQTAIDLAPESVDIVILSRPDVAKESMPQVQHRFPGATIVYDMVDFHTVRLRRQAQLSKDVKHASAADAYEQVERALFESSDLVIAVTDEEAAAVRKMVPHASVHRLGTIHPRNRGSATFKTRHGALFVGSWNHPPNRDAIEWIIDDIAPALAKSDPTIAIHIVGSDIPTNSLSVPSNVEVHGWLPSLDAITNQVRVSIAPLRFGAGIKGKIADAIARGLPVVTTPVGAEGFGPVTPAMSITESTSDFVEAIVRLHSKEREWNAISELGSDLVDELLGAATAKASIRAILKEASAS